MTEISQLTEFSRFAARVLLPSAIAQKREASSMKASRGMDSLGIVLTGRDMRGFFRSDSWMFGWVVANYHAIPISRPRMPKLQNAQGQLSAESLR